jgi:hypothetical protein
MLMKGDLQGKYSVRYICTASSSISCMLQLAILPRDEELHQHLCNELFEKCSGAYLLSSLEYLHMSAIHIVHGIPLSRHSGSPNSI